MKYCPHCKIEKELKEFSPDKYSKIGVASWCKVCCKTQFFDARRKLGIKERSHKFCPNGHDKDVVGRTESGKCVECNKLRLWKKQLRKKYKLTIEKYNDLLKNQNNKCAICELDQEIFSSHLSVDHDHITGKIRGLLCNSCNIALGHFNDSVTNLEKAIDYLKEKEKTCNDLKLK